MNSNRTVFILLFSFLSLFFHLFVCFIFDLFDRD